ncbi:hypothetical protein QBC43DRAFT_318921 [Cladorrhinum sp. PSN259]|nr:hypothetical protein QBC43DRAFT_318921 [Cladorrhinum sp. PSN259]
MTEQVELNSENGSQPQNAEPEVLDTVSDSDSEEETSEPEEEKPLGEETKDEVEYEDDPESRECFEPTVNAIRSAWTPETVASSPRSDEGWEAFRLYWHDILTKILLEVEANPDVPQFMTDPPCPKFTVMIFNLGDYDVGCCPCCLPDCKPNITIENASGVTKGELVKAVRDYLYGGHLREGPKVWKGQKDADQVREGDYGPEVSKWETEEEGMKRVRLPVVWKHDWMSGGWLDREDHSKGKRCMTWDQGEIFLFVCEVEEYEGNVVGKSAKA